MSRFNARKGALLLGAGLSALSFATAALAQEASSTALDEIVVTAERRSENLQKVPVSVAVVGGDQLRAVTADGSDILALSGKVPSFYAETTTGRIFPRFYIRGLGNIDFYLGASQPVSIIQDDVVLEHVVLKSNPVFDVQQVEVLRGPQGSLFGRNTTAGIVKFDTNKPTQTLRAAPAPRTAPTARPPSTAASAARSWPTSWPSAFRRSTSTATTTSTTPSPDQRRRHRHPEEERHGRLRREGRAGPTAGHPDRAADGPGLGPRPQLRGHLDPVPARRSEEGLEQLVGPARQRRARRGQQQPAGLRHQGASLNVAYDFGPVTLTVDQRL
jgi:iron complex outermembrane receptor protein